MHVFGLTGGIGSGKSTVARRFRARGLPVVDADELAREVVARGTPGLAEVAAAFGKDVLTNEGELDRKKLAARVFNDDEARKRLNGILHPRVRELSLTRFNELSHAGEALACYEVPLLFEVGLTETLRPVVVVNTPETTQIARTMLRDGATEADARARIAAQMPLPEKTTRADFVIDNSGTIEQTESEADLVLDAICLKHGISTARYPRP